MCGLKTWHECEYIQFVLIIHFRHDADESTVH